MIHGEIGGSSGALTAFGRVDQQAPAPIHTSLAALSAGEASGSPAGMRPSTATDGAFFVYLEDVDEAGRVTYITEGQLRALHRKVSTDAPPFKMLVPYHSFKKKDGLPLVPGDEPPMAPDRRTTPLQAPARNEPQG